MMLGLGAGHRLRAADHRPLPRAARGGRQRAATRRRSAAATSGATVVAAGLIVMVAIAGLLVIGVPFIGKIGLGAAIAVGAVVVSALTILPIMIGRLRPPAGAEEARARPAVAGLRPLGRDRDPRGRGCRSPPASLVLLIFAVPGHPAAPRPARRRQPADVAARSASPTTSSARRSARAPTARSCSPSTRRRARRTPRRSSPRSSRPSPTRPASPRSPPASRQRGRRDGDDLRRSRPPRRRTPGPATCSTACATTSSRRRPPARR